ncbi:MAG: GNAT family N-acetyltransferase [Candidatus Heimdallarchaeota archaeon]|nr:GNAT family N-acetyltransferase [Candidatus Heimdallarchaeota archaeon]
MYTIRQVTAKDIPSLIMFRIKLFREMNLISSVQEEKPFSQACFDYFQSAIERNEFIAWLAESEGSVIAVSGLVFLQKPPSPNNPSGKEAYIMNMFTLSKWRNKGIGSLLFKTLVNYVQEQGVSLIRLHTTETGQKLYEKFGFESIHNEMTYRMRT